MFKLCDDLSETVFKQIEATADPAALAQLRDALAQVADPQQREAIGNAAIALAGAWADAALMVGWQMAQDPGAWLFVDE